MGYYIKYKELQSAQSTIFAQINQWSEELEHTKEKIQTVVEMEEIKGAAANSIKSYMQEVHIPLLGYMQQLFSEYMTRMLLYGDEYYKLDTQLSAKIAQDRLEEQITSLGTGVDAFLTIEDSVAAAVSMASGLASVNAPSGERITGSYEQLTKKASQLMNEVGDCEYGHLSADFGTITDLLSNLLQIVNGQRGKNHVTITSYQVGSIAQLPAFQKIKEASAKQNTELNGSTKDLEEAINRYTQKQQERNLADEKTKAGEGQILNGLLIAGAAIAGTAAIIVTFGAATPVVVGAFTIGVTSGLYGMSTANEGVNNVILGTSGDGTTVGMNPIRDTIFASNPGLYYTIGDISTMTCVLAVPIGGATASAMTAGTSVLRAVAVEGGKTV
ncbi:MAG: T7SS effector LXG polymorphic toxin, partial [Lachnotalea sp.]